MAGSKKSKSEGIVGKAGLTIPTKKGIMKQLKDSTKSAGAGAMTGAGEVVGEAMLGEVLGPLTGGIASSLFVKDETLKKMTVFMGARKSARNMLL